MSRSLPRDTPGFLDRDEEIAQARTALAGEDGGGLVCLTGPAGVGKTCLAVRLGHELGELFPAVLFAELRGSEKDGPTPTGDVLERFLRQLGKKSEDIPSTEDDRVADFRALTHDRRVLVILDDAYSSAQVRMLTPSSPSSAVIVTSRKYLAGLVAGGGFAEVKVAEFTAELATELLRQVVDAARLAAEPVAAARLIEGCAGLPLALRMLGAWLASRARRTLAWFADRFAEAPLSRLRVDGEPSVEEIFDLRYDELDGDAKRGYCLLGEHGGSHFDADAAAAILDLPVEDTLELLDGLVDAFLLQPSEPDRYRFHPLIASHARARAEEWPAQPRTAAARRHVEYRRTRAAALARVVTNRWTIATAAVEPAYTGPDALADAHAELELDEPLYRAAVDAAGVLEMDAECAAIGEALKPWYYNTDRRGHLLEVLRVATPAAERLGDPRIAMRLHNDLGSTYEGLGEFDLALTEYTLSRRFADGHPLGAASAVEGLGLVCRGRGEHERAVACYREARAILQAMTSSSQEERDQRERALVLLEMHLGTELGLLDRHDEGDGDLRHAGEWFARRGEPVNQARVLVALAEGHRSRDELDQARGLLTKAAAMFERAGFRSQQAEAVVSRAEVELDIGDQDAARDLLSAARTLFERVGQWRRVEEMDTRLAAMS